MPIWLRLFVIAPPPLIAVIVPFVISLVRPFDPPLEIEIQRQEKWARRVLVGGILAAIPVCLIVLSLDPFERGAYRAAPLFGLLVLYAVCAAEVWTMPSKARPQAVGVATRRVGDLVPSRLCWAVSITTVALLVSAAAGALTGTDGRFDGRSATPECTLLSWTVSPYPGPLFTIPILTLTATAVVTATFALRIIANRRTFGDSPADDFAARQRAASAVVSGTGIAMAIPLIGVSMTGGLALLTMNDRYMVFDGGVIRCDSALRVLTGATWITVGLLAFPILTWSIGSLIDAMRPTVSVPRQPDPPPHPVPDGSNAASLPNDLPGPDHDIPQGLELRSVRR